MSGWATVVTIVGLMTVAAIGLNASLWMRHRAMAAARGGWGDGDFVDALAAIGCSSEVIDALRIELAGYYSASLSPRPEDDLEQVLRIDAGEIERVVERLFSSLGLPMPNCRTAETIPVLKTVGDLAMYTERRRDQLTMR